METAAASQPTMPAGERSFLAIDGLTKVFDGTVTAPWRVGQRGFGLRREKLPEDAVAERVEAFLKLVQLETVDRPVSAAPTQFSQLFAFSRLQLPL